MLPSGRTQAAQLRLSHLDRQAAHWRLFALDEHSVAGSRAGGVTVIPTDFGAPLAELNPYYAANAYEPAPFDFGAYDRNRILYGVDLGAGPVKHFAGGRIYLHSFRFLFGLDENGAPKWIHAQPRADLIGSDLTGPAIVYAAADGEVGVIDAGTGQTRVIGQTGERLTGAVFDARGFSAMVGTDAPAADRVKSLEQIVWDHDARLGAVKVYATSLMGSLTGVDAAPATRALIKIVVADKGVSPAAQKRAGDELVRRKDAQAVSLYLDALKVHYDYLEDRHPHGSDALARTLAALSVKSAIPLIAAQLLDHDTPQSELSDLATSLGTLGQGSAEATRAVTEFFLEYRSDPLFLGDPSLLAAASALMKVGGISGRRTVSFAASDPRTLTTLAQDLTHLLEASQKASQKTKASAEPAAPSAKK